MNKKFEKAFYEKKIYNIINKTNPLKRFSFRKKLNKEKILPISIYNPFMIFLIDYYNKKKFLKQKIVKVLLK